MKKFALIFCLLVISIGANAQFEKGKWVISPSVTNLGFSYSNAEKAKFGFGVDAGAFLVDDVALMVQLGADWSKPTSDYTLGAGGRYYFEKTGVYLGAGLDFNRTYYKHGYNSNAWGLGLECGYAFFISHTVTIQPAAYYKWRFNDSDLSKFGIKVGFGIYL